MTPQEQDVIDSAIAYMSQVIDNLEIVRDQLERMKYPDVEDEQDA